VTTPFRTLRHDRPLRAVVVGAGPMGRGWSGAVAEANDADLVGIVDLDVEVARAAVDELELGAVAVASDLTTMCRDVEVDVVVDATVPEAHHAVTVEALAMGIPVLGEKPLAATMAEALSLVAATEAAGELFMVSQSRRYDRNLFALADGFERIGHVGILTCTFFRAPRFGGFRDEMDHPLLLDMAVHPFDIARFLLGVEPVAVYCEEYNPPGSWYRGDAAATAIFELADGARFVYSGSWCSPGQETSWNGTWRVSGSAGTASWDGDGPPLLGLDGEAPVPLPASDEPEHEAIAGSLDEFLVALRTGRTPMGTVRDNVRTLAMVHAAIRSAETGVRVRIDDVLEGAFQQARDLTPGWARPVLDGWPSVQEAIRSDDGTGTHVRPSR
jgi:predicted dehydrogenase